MVAPASQVTGENNGFELDNKRITPDAMDSLMCNERLDEDTTEDGKDGNDVIIHIGIDVNMNMSIKIILRWY